jgi:outer membrane lipoprotein-sorting protein
MKTESVMIILILLGIFFTSGCTKEQTLESDENKIIMSFSEHLTSIRDYSGTVLQKIYHQDPVLEQYRIHVRYPDNYKVEYIESSHRNAGIILILDANEFLEYDLVNSQTIQAQVNPEGNSVTSHDYLGLLNQILPEGNIRYTGVEYLENQPAYVIEIQPEKPGDDFNLKYSEFRFSLVKVWVDPETWVVKKIELYDSNGNGLIVSAEYQELSENSGFPDDVFSKDDYLQYTIVTAPTHPPIVKYPGVEYPE